MQANAVLTRDETNKETKERRYAGLLDQSLRIFFQNAVKVCVRRPSQAYYFLRTVRWQQKAAAVRKQWVAQGVAVPPILIFSITNRCNLRCKGCYHHALRESTPVELSTDKMRSIIAEARGLGISFMVLAGGEPFMRPELLSITAEFPDVVFFVFTNGLLLDEEKITQLKRQRNVIPIISLEGHRAETDERRGNGVYGRLKYTLSQLKANGIFAGVSLTVTSRNFETVTDESFVRELLDTGIGLFFYIEYSPIQEGTEDWCPTGDQRQALIRLSASFRERYPALFVTIPGDEDQFGGCLSAGRGFVHINPEGDVEPCPFAPYSDSNLRGMSLLDALKSPFLCAIRENSDELAEGAGGCALWEKREWVKDRLKASSVVTIVS